MALNISVGGAIRADGQDFELAPSINYIQPLKGTIKLGAYLPSVFGENTPEITLAGWI